MQDLPPLTAASSLLLFVAAMLGGALNSVAGGGSFISFPALLFTEVPSKIANATSTIALWPGSVSAATAYRKELQRQRQLLLVMGGTSLVGGLLGAVLLLRTPARTFDFLVPWLLLLAALLFTFGSALTGRLRQRMGKEANSALLGIGGIAVLQLVISVYGGYFGGGIGIMMLATLALLGMSDIHSMNAIKTIMQAAINGVAVVTFIAAGAVAWPQAVVMIAGGLIGGYAGATFAKRLPSARVRQFVIVVAFAMTLYFFIRQYVVGGAR